MDESGVRQQLGYSELPEGHLVYTACPSRLDQLRDEIMRFVTGTGNGPLNPFNALPYEHFEGGVHGRSRTLDFCCRLIDGCDELWLFGVSEGTLLELEYAVSKGLPVRVFVRAFDPQWREFTNVLRSRFPRGANFLLTQPDSMASADAALHPLPS